MIRRTALGFVGAIGASLFLFSSQGVFADSYTKEQLSGVIDKAMEAIREDFLFYEEAKDAQCRREIADMIAMKLARETSTLRVELETLEDGGTKNDANTEKAVCLDKHTHVFTPRETKNMMIQTSGTVAGIGTTISEVKGRAVVLEVMKGSPAENAGILPGDVLLKARNEDDASFIDLKGSEHAAQKIRGPQNSTVYLVIEREGIVIELPAFKRAIVEVPSVAVKEFGNVGYVAVSSFSQRTGDELEDALDGLVQKGIGRVVLDFRNNPGGVLEGAIETLYYWNTNPEDRILTVRHRNGEQVFLVKDPLLSCPALGCFPFLDPRVNAQKTPGRLKDLKVVILINKFSASASELFAGVMKDWGDVQNKVILVGEPTYGKGVGQSVSGLPFGFSLARTTFEYLVGNSKTKVNDIGIFPDYLLDDTRESPEDTFGERDQQWRQALAIVREMQ